ncbi:NusG antitermination factor [Thermoanaerobacter mathranii subsp. mathranii str. A3]|jgi:transcriptional antiterminator NusG|uniref:Transcription termination/antitermination protein NusG n=2 Tax=Thermoanaerobacter TaxID=1754 RepID=D3T7S1_THEIA|nr:MULTISPECIES: antiterminator LoaP [Thermoanaerobacter]ADD02003.1 NusG antitermination factor [Thermoanaerobacter italicus Ab9]ADH60502.1 NusG antitermination factor [Thermoanaerobacter mathranii subsp. mathranii str. A3]MBT1279496.1 antiterminator LoaP [Thermoanaerobacter sp. CM-CNRG TB177]MDK2814646.1 transcription termination/antitermination protein NusG [Thermoanaerobacter sp.]
MKKWYVIFTRGGFENKVKDIIQNCFKEEVKLLVPKRKIIERVKGQPVEKIKLLFPGYVFVNAEMSDELYYKMSEVLKRGVFLKEGKRPAFVREEEMKIILSLIKNSDLIDVSKGIMEGERVKIIEGPLKGYEGLIKKIDKRKKRAKVMLSIAGELKSVDLAIEVIENASEQRRSLVYAC